MFSQPPVGKMHLDVHNVSQLLSAAQMLVCSRQLCIEMGLHFIAKLQFNTVAFVNTQIVLTLYVQLLSIKKPTRFSQWDYGLYLRNMHTNVNSNIKCLRKQASLLNTNPKSNTFLCLITSTTITLQPPRLKLRCS